MDGVKNVASSASVVSLVVVVVSMVDIVKMQRYLLRLDALQGEDILQRADLNQDHVVNVTDLIEVSTL